MKYTYIPCGVCSRQIDLELNGETVVDVHVTGGCHGNLQGLSALCRGRKAGDLIAALRGIRCGHKATSCPDQLATALEQALAHCE